LCGKYRDLRLLLLMCSPMEEFYDASAQARFVW